VQPQAAARRQPTWEQSRNKGLKAPACTKPPRGTDCAGLPQRRIAQARACILPISATRVCRRAGTATQRADRGRRRGAPGG
jgi:hypothetical protein